MSGKGRESREVTWEWGRSAGRGLPWARDRSGGVNGEDSIPRKVRLFTSCGTGWGVRGAAGPEGWPRESCGDRTGGSVWGCPGPGSGPSQSSAQAPRRRRGLKGHAHLLLLEFIGHLGRSGPGPASAAPLRLRLCSAALGPLGVSSPPPARCARVDRCLRLQLVPTLTNLPDNQAPPLRIGHWSQAASFFSHWEGRVQTARVRLQELAQVGGPAPKWVELSEGGGGKGKPELST